MTKKIFKAIIFAVGVVLISSLVIVMGGLYDYFNGVRETQMRDQLELATVAVEENGVNYLKKLKLENYSFTLVASDGTVLYNTRDNAKTMENYSSRSEIQQALKNGEGESSQYSSGFLQKTMCYAKRLSDGNVLCISLDHTSAGSLVLGMLQPIIIVLAIALVMSGILARQMSRRIAEPLNRLDLEKPLENDAYEEIAPLLTRINHQHQEITRQLWQLQRKRDEFAQITASMKEGLVILDANNIVLSINPAAQKLFDTDRSCVGSDFLTVDRSLEMNTAIKKAKERDSTEIRIERNGRVYHFEISNINSGGEVIGTVILSFDITEQEAAERNRREFTANVSHELKTPLQGIIGSAELLETGMVNKDDEVRFIGHIRTEAARMVTLIEDIIRLSRLDEGGTMPDEIVDLSEIAREVIENLQDAAKEKGITLSVQGESGEVNGERRLLYEIVFNLCDNAIKYNEENGKVDVTIASDELKTSVTVKDTGIGIPLEHQDRIFERFYRVDKSHSRTSGGTGLGLSIVKHAVQYHQGEIELKSEPNKGTEITITFPRQ